MMNAIGGEYTMVGYDSRDANREKSAQDIGRVAVELVKLAFKVIELLVVVVGLILIVKGQFI